MMKPSPPEEKASSAETAQSKWYREGYQHGHRFAVTEADYDELAAIYRVGGIPYNWDIFRAEILNTHLEVPGFDFKAYTSGFAQACIQFFEKL